MGNNWVRTWFFFKDKKQSLWSGAVYGFSLSVAFLVSGFEGKSLLVFIPFLLLLSLVGTLCGLVLGFTGSAISNKTG